MIGFKPNAFRGTFSVPMHLSRAFLWKFQLLIDVVEEMKWKKEGGSERVSVLCRH